MHALGAATYAREHLAERGCGGVDIDRSSSNVGEKRMKHHMVLAVEQEDLAVGSGQLVAKSFRELYGGKSSTDDDHSDLLHFLAPNAGRNAKPAFFRGPLIHHCNAGNDSSAF